MVQCSPTISENVTKTDNFQKISNGRWTIFFERFKATCQMRYAANFTTHRNAYTDDGEPNQQKISEAYMCVFAFVLCEIFVSSIRQ